jgi:NADH-quinone oxidoreductase subunit N
MLLIGFGFKVATVPFHMWAPDVYEGAPSAITAYMAATVKAAAFAAFIRVWLEAFPFSTAVWHPAVSGLAIATMVFGNAIGIVQRNLKRLLAYSSIGHAGYLLVAIASGTFQASSAMLFYLFVYTLATFGAFAVVVALTREGQKTVMLDDLAGLWSVRPWLAFSMGVLMFALLGFPIFGGAGFFAKWYVLQAALQAPVKQTTLAVVLVLTTVVSAGYYLYVVMLMFMRPRAEDALVPERSGGLTRVVLGVSVALILILGVVPELAVRLAGGGRLRMEITPTGAAARPAATGLPPADRAQIVNAAEQIR